MSQNTNGITRRQFLILAGSGSAALVLASCGAGGIGGGADSGPVTLEFLSWGGDEGAYEKLIASYKEANPNVTVNLTPTPGGEFYAKLNTMIAGDTTPNLSSFQGWEWQPFFDKGVLADLSDLVAADSYFSNVYDDSINSITVSTLRDGKRVLVPMQWGTMLMFYSKPVFDAAGVAYPTNDWTMEDFVDIAEQLTSGDGANKTFGTWANGSWFRDIHYIRTTGKQEFDSLEDPKKATFNQKEIVDMIQLIAQDLVYKMGAAPTSADTEGGAVAIESGNVGMKYEGAWYMPNMNTPELREAGTQVEFDVVLMPQGADGTRPHRGWSEGIAIPTTDHVDAAWSFASYLASEEGNKVYATETGRIPNTAALVSDFWVPVVKERFGVENASNFIEAFKRSEVDVVGGISRSKFWAEAVKPVGYDPILANDATAAEVMPAVDTAVQAILDEFWG